MTSDQLLELLEQRYRAVEDRLVAYLRLALAQNRVVTRKDVRRVQAQAKAELGTLEGPSKEIVGLLVAAAVAEGDTQAGADLALLPAAVLPAAAGTALPATVTAGIAAAVAGELLSKLTESRTAALQRTTALAQRAKRKVTVSKLIGEARSEDVTADVARQLVDKGVVGLVDRSGRDWSITRYAKTVGRTLASEAETSAALARFSRAGINHVRWDAQPEPCPICKPLDGRVVSIDGTLGTFHGERVTSLASVDGGPPAHPNCRCVLRPALLSVSVPIAA